MTIKFEQRMLGGTSRLHLLAPLGYQSLNMTAHTPDLWLGGQGGRGAARGLLKCVFIVCV